MGERKTKSILVVMIIILLSITTLIYSLMSSEGKECIINPFSYGMDKLVETTKYECSCDIENGPVNGRVHFNKTSFVVEEDDLGLYSNPLIVN